MVNLHGQQLYREVEAGGVFSPSRWTPQRYGTNHLLLIINVECLKTQGCWVGRLGRKRDD